MGKRDKLSFSFKNTTKTKVPKVNWEYLKNDVLGKSYDLSLIFCAEKKSKQLNYIYRGKNKSTNVLSFPVEKNLGEIFIDLNTTKREAKSLGQTFNDRLTYLYVHGLLHLSGLDHGKKMDSLEAKYVNRLKLKI